MARSVPLSRFTPRVGGGSAFFVRPLDRAVKKLILFSLPCLLIQGCVGVGVMKTQTNVIQSPGISLLSNTPGVDDVVKRDSLWATNSGVNTIEELKMYWGKPNKVTQISGGSDEIWTYKFKSIWEGVIPFVIIPIPLVLPVGTEKVCLTLRDGHIVSASGTKSCMAGGTYGVILSPEGGGRFRRYVF